MATHAHSTPTSNAPPSRRRTLFAAAGAVILGSGIAAGVAASIADHVLVEVEPDATLLALRPDLLAAVADLGWSEMVNEISDERITEVGKCLRSVCWEIVEAPPAQTAAGRALKAAGAMYQFRDGFNHGHWPGDGEAMAWDVLSQIAGDFYVPPAMPERIRHLCEPERV